MDGFNLAIIIPAFNEEKTITKIVSAVMQYGTPVVIDDGSTDRTALLAQQFGAIVIEHEKNYGYDRALNSGFQYAERNGFSAVLTIDGDGQLDPENITSFVNSLKRGNSVVVGIRNRKQRVSERVFALATNIKWGIRDPLCGMKAYKILLYKELGHFDSYNSIGTELLLYAAKKGASIEQIPLTLRMRPDSSRFGSPFFANIKILRALWLGLRFKTP